MFGKNHPRAARYTAAALTAAALGFGSALPASAAAVAHPEFTGCGWTPANNSNNPGSYLYDYVNIRTGADLSCSVKTANDSVSDHLMLRCLWYNSATGYTWYYLTDETRGVTGWSRADLVTDDYPDGYVENC